jgi:defect-in-organelle-trafficking protein DotC
MKMRQQVKKHIGKLIFATAAGCAMLLGGCTTTSYVSTSANVGYVNLSQLPNGDGEISKIRLQAIKETAGTLGARGALAWRGQRINASLEQQASYMDHVFDFNQLILKNNVLPPVLTESSGNLTLDNSDTIRSSDRAYKIVLPARFATTAPSWRDYLWMLYKKPVMPDKTLLPTSKAEAEVWNAYLKKGWEEGLTQANDIFAVNLSRLKRDYLGMLLYRKLLRQNIISSPTVSKADLGVTGDKNELHINDQITRITVHSALNPSSNEWKPVITDPMKQAD